MTMNDIENLTRQYADARGVLSSRVRTLEAKLAAEKEQRLPAIKTALAKAKEAEARLKAALEESPELFAKPKTQILHGIRVGFQKMKGAIMWKDADTVVQRIKKFLPKQADVLIKVSESPVKNALANVSAEDLKKLGVTVEETGEAVVIKPVDGEVEKIVNALLNDRTDEEEAA